MIKFKTNFNLIFLFSTILLIFYSCSNTDKKISLKKVEGSPAYDNSSIEIKDISNKGENFMFSFDINNYDRTYHGAMLDTNILADVYFHLTGGQSKFEFSSNLSPETNEAGIKNQIEASDIEIPSFKANSNDVSEHKKRLNEIESQNNIATLLNQS